ncbi:MAG: molybdopterin-dependent oxidoreductase [Planctomycetes bacterium]|nr:molybdopterin-dependent oxidoreductase [Planctomycetota bacterium]
MDLSRRQFMGVGGAGFLAALPGSAFGLRLFQSAVDNPLAHYPDRGWEKIYRDQYRYDSTFSFVCSPNDTHACRLKAFVRNGVALRTEAPYEMGRISDLYGNKATWNWGPRTCNKGFTLPRRIYGPYRLKYPIVRAGWKQWADDGFPYLTPALRSKYKFDSRGSDRFLRLAWPQAFDYLAKGLTAIAAMYSGPDGARRLKEEGYVPEMIEETHQAGTRTLKFRGGMGLLGVIGKYGMYRLSNTMALLDTHVRGVSEQDALGGRIWDNYTWHGDQAPGHPFVHGLQTSDVDFNQLRFAKLHIQTGKNLVENKMTDSHWFIEIMERGGKIVTIAPEYSPPATKADYWIPTRPNTDAALWLGISKLLIDGKRYDETFLREFTDFPLLVRTDTLKRLKAKDLDASHACPALDYSTSYQGLTKEQHAQICCPVVWDRQAGGPRVIHREEIGHNFKVDCALEGRFNVTLADGQTVEVLPLFEMYKEHLKDYDLETVHEITHSPKDLIERLANDIATIKPVAIHVGEGINHWFHATLMNRAEYLPLILTGNIGIPGSGCHTWAGNYKAANFQGSPWTGKGFKCWIAEDPFHPNLDPAADGKDLKVRGTFKDEAVAYWNHGDKPLIVDTPKYGRKCFTGKTAMPTPTKSIFFTNVNLINNAKWAYEMIKNVDPKINLIVSVDIEMTASVEYADFGLPANSWMESTAYEVTSSCSNPFLQIWKGGLKPLYDSKDDVKILAGVAEALGRLHGDGRFADYWKFALEGREEIYIQRLMDASTTLRGYSFKDIMDGKYGEPGTALMLFRTYPREAFWEQIHESRPFYTDTGRLHAYCDIPEAIEYGENFVVHREGPEATPYLPNVIVSSNPWIRPEDYGLDPNDMDADVRHVRNIKKPWADVKRTQNPLWAKGYQFYCLTPKTRHRVHSQWSACDWNLIWDSNFGDPYRHDKRSPGVGEHQLHVNPQAAKDLGIRDGDYVYVDSNPADRPYVGARPDDPFYKVARCMLRVKYNPAYPYHTVMMKHAPYIATERSVKAHESRPDGRALSEDTGYQANLRYGSQQSITRSWLMPMHQTDSLFHKQKVYMGFLFGSEADNHAINTTPKETLVKITKAENGGLAGIGPWKHGLSGFAPGQESGDMEKFLGGRFIEVDHG